MDVSKYVVPTATKDGFMKAFKTMMDIEVKSIAVVENLMHHVEPAGDLPVGFVKMEKGKWCLVGWTDRKKRTSCQNLNPWKKPCVLLYGNWSNRKWQIRDLYKCVFSRIRQLSDYPDIIRSIANWEDSRQSLYTLVSMLDNNLMKRLMHRELELLEHVMVDNPELLHATCEQLGLKPNLETLKEHVKEQYGKPLNIKNKEGFKKSGLLETVEGHLCSKWTIKETSDE